MLDDRMIRILIDPDSGGPKPYGSDGSGSATLMGTSVLFLKRLPTDCSFLSTAYQQVKSMWRNIFTLLEQFVNSVSTEQCGLCKKHFDLSLPPVNIYYEGSVLFHVMFELRPSDSS